MLLGPIFRVELVSTARRRRYFLLRVLYAALILFIMWVTYESTRDFGRYDADRQTSIRQMATTARVVFVAFSTTQLLGILAIAPAMAVGTIATERERRTIEYLFATDLSNLEIILGKTVARFLLIAMFVLASVPILLIFRLLGGIPADLLFASFIIAGSTAVFLTAISVCVSVWSPRSRDAAMRVYRILAALLFLPPILYFFLAIGVLPMGALRDALNVGVTFLRELNPMFVMGAAMANTYSSSGAVDMQPVLRMAGWHLALSVALVAWATVAVRRVHLRDASSAKTAAKVERGPRRGILPRWRPDMFNHPMVWKEAFAPTSKTKLGLVAWLANFLVVIVALGSILYAFFYAWYKNNHNAWDEHLYFGFTAGFTGFVGSLLLLLLGARASGLVTIEKERDCWISLLATPLTGCEIMRGKMLGNLYSARWGFFLLLFAWALAAILDVRYLLVGTIMAGAFLVCAWFVTNLGLLFSLRSTTSMRAMGLTLLTGLFIGGGYMMCCCPIVAIAVTPKSGDTFMFGLGPCMPYLLASPGIGFLEAVEHRQTLTEAMGDEDVLKLSASYIFGIIGYISASIILMGYFARNFDAIAGRTTKREGAAC
jgi:ABC-type transport system involved in multi-copper enzyme maturation permease subunit